MYIRTEAFPVQAEPTADWLVPPLKGDLLGRGENHNRSPSSWVIVLTTNITTDVMRNKWHCHRLQCLHVVRKEQSPSLCLEWEISSLIQLSSESYEAGDNSLQHKGLLSSQLKHSIKHWKRLPKEVVQSPSLEFFKT